MKVVDAKYVRDYIIRIRFDDGMEGDVDFQYELEGPVFVPLKDVAIFRQFRVHPELHTIVWPNGADFAPEFLYEKTQIAA